MKKIGKKNVIIIIIILLILIIGIILGIGLTGLKKYSEINKESKNIISYEEELSMANESQEEILVDLSDYEETGEFTEDGIAWVYKEGYNGKGCGYINKNGEFVIPIQEDILQTDLDGLSINYDDYHNGIVLIARNEDWGKYTITAYDTDGNDVSNMETKNPYIRIQRFQGVKNPFIFLNGNNYIYSEVYIFDMNTKEFKQVREKDFWQFGDNFGDGLLYCYSEGSIIYLDENGDEALKITTDSNENYVGIEEASDFINGEATLLFRGKDGNEYTVTIDKTGKWLDEPVKHENAVHVRND